MAERWVTLHFADGDAIKINVIGLVQMLAPDVEQYTFSFVPSRGMILCEQLGMKAVDSPHPPTAPHPLNYVLDMEEHSDWRAMELEERVSTLMVQLARLCGQGPGQCGACMACLVRLALRDQQDQIRFLAEGEEPPRRND